MVRVRVAYAGVCHSDLHIREDSGEVSLRKGLGEENFNKIVLGHEISGYVDEIGPKSGAEQLGFQKGHRVAVYPWQSCQNCPSCAIGNTNLCFSEHYFMFWLGCSPNCPGGFSTHVLTAAKFLVKLPENVPLDVGAILMCSGGTVMAALKKVEEQVNFGAATNKSGKARILILGAGGLGLWGVKLAKALYGEKVEILVAEIDQSKIDTAKTYGADGGYLWSRNNSEEANAALVTNEGKVNAIIDLIALPSTAQTGLRCLQKNGKIVLVGLHGGKFTIPSHMMIYPELSMCGSIAYTLEMGKELVDLVSKNNITYPNISYYSLDEVNTALDLLEQGKITGRAIIKHSRL
jgi:D-arabinose 1-dehydrogenase-like Zn-dependent alcohol dehydrogenase